MGVVLLVLCGCPGAAKASLRTLDVRPLSGVDPFIGQCGIATSPIFGSAAEPQIAVDPVHGDQVLASWQQDRFGGGGGALSTLTAFSGNAGQTWQIAAVPNISRCTGGADERASDSWGSIGPDGRDYLSLLSFTPNAAAGEGTQSPSTVTATTAAGPLGAWTQPAVVAARNAAAGPLALAAPDRPSITADPTRPATAYAIWTYRYGLLGESGTEFFAATFDGGHSWSQPTAIYSGPPLTQAQPGLLIVLPNGELLNVLNLINVTPFLPSPVPRLPYHLLALRSTDQGRHWSGPSAIADISPATPHDPDSGTAVRSFPIVSAAAGADGTAYAAWNQIYSDHSSEILLSRSRDGGRTWGDPETVAHVPAQAFLPSVAVNRGASVAVSWDDFRNDRPGDGQLSTDVWLAYSRGAPGSSWPQLHLGGPFDALAAPQTSSSSAVGRFLGDYQGLAPLGRDGFIAIFAQARPQVRNGVSQVFVARITPVAASARTPSTKALRACLRLRPTHRRGRQRQGRTARHRCRRQRRHGRR